MADKDADAGLLPALVSRSGGYSAGVISVPRAAASKFSASAAAPLASTTVSGMSLGSRNGPAA